MIDARIVKRLATPRAGSDFTLDVHIRSDSAVSVILGPSGAGKTLTLNCLAGFIRPDAGRILIGNDLMFDGDAQVHIAPQQRRCGYIFQDHSLFPHMTVRANLRFAAQSMQARRQSRLDQQQRIKELLELFELGELGDRKPHQLSGGQKQRVAIARALVGNPRLLLLDEPARGLNLQLREAFYGVLRLARERSGSPIVIVTHDLEECFQLADDLFFLDNGRCLQSGKKDDLIARPGSLQVARLLGIYVLLAAEIQALDPGRNVAKLFLLGQELETRYLPGHLIGDRGWLCVRRSELTVLDDIERPQRNQLMAEPLNSSSTLQGVRLNFAHGLSAEVSEAEFAKLKGSRKLRLEFPPESVHFLSE